MLIVLEKFLDWKSIGAFTSMQIYAQNKDICYLILSGTIILLLSISISLFPILCTKPKKILAEAVMISIIGMLLSFAISPIIAETSASYLAKETQTLRLEQQEQENTGTYIDGYIAPDLKIQDVEVHITKEMVLMDIGMISGILIIAVLVAGITIMKKRPKQILSEMS